MFMKSSVLLFGVLFLFLLSPLSAQQHQVIEPAIFEFQYEHTMQGVTGTGIAIPKDLMILRVGENVSQFFSYHTFFADSLIASGCMTFGRLTAEAVRRRDFANRPGMRTTHDYLYKNFPAGKITNRTNLLMQHFTYEESFEPQEWTIVGDTVREILGYTSFLAFCDFRGRRFYAWFTPDIPISDGPWKFAGLPGLIMEVYDSDHIFHYVIIGMQSSNLRPVTLYNFGRYEKTTRTRLLRARREAAEQGLDQIRPGTSEPSAPSNDRPRNVRESLERDY